MHDESYRKSFIFIVKNYVPAHMNKKYARKEKPRSKITKLHFK